MCICMYIYWSPLAVLLKTDFNAALLQNKWRLSSCAQLETVIVTILRAVTGTLSNSPALQRTPPPPPTLLEIGTRYIGKYWWRMKEAFSGQRDGSYRCLSHTHTHLYTYLSVTIYSRWNNERCSDIFIISKHWVGCTHSPWGIISIYHTC